MKWNCNFRFVFAIRQEKIRVFVFDSHSKVKNASFIIRMARKEENNRNLKSTFVHSKCTCSDAFGPGGLPRQNRREHTSIRVIWFHRGLR